MCNTKPKKVGTCPLIHPNCFSLRVIGLGLCCDKISNVNETENNSGELTDKYQKVFGKKWQK